MPIRHVVMLLVYADDRILLEKRPASGIWGGLYSLPEIGPGSGWRQLLGIEGTASRVMSIRKYSPTVSAQLFNSAEMTLEEVIEVLEVCGRKRA